MVKEKLKGNIKMLLISIAISVGLIFVGLLSYDIGVFGYTIILSTFIIALPQFLLRYQRFRELKEMEEKLPLFLRDNIESIRSGMPFHKAIIVSSRVDYGKLSKEVKKMAHQLSWGMPLDKALDQFARRVKKSKRLFTTIKIVREAHLSGGDVVSTLDRVSDNSKILDEATKERASMLNQYVILMYAIGIIFIIIVVAINNLMIPIFEVASAGAMDPETELGGGALGLINPCDNCIGFGCGVCDIYKGTASTIFSMDPSTIGAYYTALFFFMSLVQSMFAGLVAGQISENSIIAGAKHSLILTGITFGAFNVLIRLGLLGG